MGICKMNQKGMVSRPFDYSKLRGRIKEKYGKEGYKTISHLWNAHVAAERLLEFHRGFIAGDITPPEDGPFSRAEIIKPDFWATGKLGE